MTDGPVAEATSPEYFEAMWATGDDPWDHGGRFYEHRKYALTAAILDAERYESIFEPGCATGILTEMLAPRATRYLATDRHPRAVEVTRARLAQLEHVRVEQGELPRDWPAEHFDAIVLSEVLYYLDEEAVAAVLDRAASSLPPGAELVAVHYRPLVADHALRGDAVHALIEAHGAWRREASHLEDQFVLEQFRRR
jgi:SAM-dependent methyltransferase